MSEVLKRLERWIDEQLKANPPLNERFLGYRQALIDVKNFIWAAEKTRGSGENEVGS